MGADPPHRAVHEPVPVPPLGVVGAELRDARPHGVGGGRRRRRRSRGRPCSLDGPRSSAVTASPRRWRPYSCARAEWRPAPPSPSQCRRRSPSARGSVRRRGTDHRHWRSARVAARPGAPRVGQRAQDHAGLRRGGGDGGDLRCPAGGRGARHRAAAVRVLEPRPRPARRRDEHRRRRARSDAGIGAALRHAAARLLRPVPAAVVRPRGCRLRPVGDPHRSRVVHRRGRLSAASGLRALASRHRRRRAGPRSACCSCPGRSVWATTSSTTPSRDGSPSPRWRRLPSASW